MERKIILASHGKMAKGVVDSVSMIAGTLNHETIAYELEVGHHPSELVEEVEKEVKEYPDKEFVIITDLYGASVCTAFFNLVKYPNVKLFSGLCLNLVLSLEVEYPDYLTESDLNTLVKEAQMGIQVLSLSETNQKEDF